MEHVIDHCSSDANGLQGSRDREGTRRQGARPKKTRPAKPQEQGKNAECWSFSLDPVLECLCDGAFKHQGHPFLGIRDTHP